MFNKNIIISLLVLVFVVGFIGTVGAKGINWGPVNHSRPDQIEKNGLSVEKINSLQKEDWTKLLDSKKKLNFAFSLTDKDGKDITNEVNPIIEVNIQGLNGNQTVRFSEIDINTDHLIGEVLNSQAKNDYEVWTVPATGRYKIIALGAGAGGRGGKAGGILELRRGKKLQIKTHSRNTGGGRGGSGGKRSYNTAGRSGSGGSGGTIIKMEEELILAAGGAGGRGASGVGGGGRCGYSRSSGGSGGNGGEEGYRGSKGGDGRGNSTKSGGSGGSYHSNGGSGGSGSYSGKSGANGSTIYDGGGGGGSGSANDCYPSGSGGGGAGGANFLHETIEEPINESGINAEDGKVIVEYLGN
jgi:hypothetical protein